MAQDDSKQLLQDFLDKFKDPNSLSPDMYTGNGDNRDDFTYWVEWKLDCFGGIKGGSSYKFGIYKCNKEPDTKRSGYKYDQSTNFAWASKYGETKEDAFKKIIDYIKDVVTYVRQEPIAYDKIEKIDLGPAYKWKIAFLYSNNRLVPVYQKKALITAAKRLGILKQPTIATIANLQELLMNYYNSHMAEYKNDICSFGSYVWTLGTSDLSQSNQIIKYGAPGTGKTYSVKIEAKEFFDIWKLDAQNSTEIFSKNYEFVQFHPSYSYEDFIEGIKPILNSQGKTVLQLKDGIFKTFCKKAAKYELWLLEQGIIKPDDKVKSKLCNITVEDVKEYNDCPIKIPQDAEDDEPIENYIPPYFFAIDEINRADLSRVFGELMYCLEYRGYRGKIKTQYSELESGDTIFYKDNNSHYFFIPENVYIIGTMNTIDRSIESFDFALRRRFLWQRVEPSTEVLKAYFEKEHATEFGNKMIPQWINLNKAIANNPLLGEDYEIGHSYLMKLDKYKCDKPSVYRDIIWLKHIKPILEEYFRGMGKEAKDQIDRLCKLFLGNVPQD